MLDVFIDELKKVAEEESTAKKVLHHPATTAAAVATILAGMGHATYKTFAKGQTVGGKEMLMTLGPGMTLMGLRALFPKTAEYPRFRDPVNDRTQPEVSRGLEPTFRLTPRPKPVTAFKLPPT